MGSSPQIKPTPDRLARSAGDRRDVERTPLNELSCDRGEILDLSSSGARLQTRRLWKEGKVRPITISTDTELVTILARCMWSMREGLFLHTVGLHFEGVTPEQAGTLTKLARSHGVRTLGLGYSDAA